MGGDDGAVRGRGAEERVSCRTRLAAGPISRTTEAAGRTRPRTGGCRCFRSGSGQEAGVYAQANRGGARLSSQSFGIWSSFQVARVTLRVVRPPERTILLQRSVDPRESVDPVLRRPLLPGFAAAERLSGIPVRVHAIVRSHSALRVTRRRRRQCTSAVEVPPRTVLFCVLS